MQINNLQIEKDNIKNNGRQGFIIPLRAIEHYKENGKIDWVDEWQLCDNWQGVRKRD